MKDNESCGRYRSEGVSALKIDFQIFIKVCDSKTFKAISKTNIYVEAFIQVRQGAISSFGILIAFKIDVTAQEDYNSSVISFISDICFKLLYPARFLRY